MEKKQIKVVAAVIRQNDKIFATQRGYGPFKDGWEFPGGKIEKEETPEAAIVREIHEELDTKIIVDDYLTTVEYDYPEFHLTMDCFWCSIVEGHLQLLEHEAAKWLPLTDLWQVDWLPADILVVESIEKYMDCKQHKESSNNTTIEYYENNAESFSEGTFKVDFSSTQERFFARMPKDAYILDFGCGAGRDTKYFLSRGARVDAVDGSANLCKIATENTGIFVRQMLFSELDSVEEYDGIWACASILHLPKVELRDVLGKMIRAVKAKGCIYTSFKYGDYEGYRKGRYFTDFTEKEFRKFVGDFGNLEIVEEWISEDVRPGREKEKWLNLIMQKK